MTQESVERGAGEGVVGMAVEHARGVAGEDEAGNGVRQAQVRSENDVDKLDVDKPDVEKSDGLARHTAGEEEGSAAVPQNQVKSAEEVVVDKPVEHGAHTAGEDEVNTELPQTHKKMTSSPEVIDKPVELGANSAGKDEGSTGMQQNQGTSAPEVVDKPVEDATQAAGEDEGGTAMQQNQVASSPEVVAKALGHGTDGVGEDGASTAMPQTEVASVPEVVDKPIEHAAGENELQTEVPREGLVDKPVEIATRTAGEDGVSTAMPQTQRASASQEAFALPKFNSQADVSTSANTATSKSRPSLATLRTMTTKKWRGPSDEELKTMVVIPKYLSRDMANAVVTKGVAIPEGPPAGEKVEAPSCPILVFINSKSGGRLGPELVEHFEELISPEQVYDLSKHSPAAVLRYGVGCLDKMADSDECARQTRRNLRILVAGGDGTVGWVLSSVGALGEVLETMSDSSVADVPPVGVVPLGTGNDLSRSFGWGGAFTSTAKSSLKKYLVKALGSKIVPLDTWNAVVLPAKSVASEDILFPHAMKPQQHVPLPTSVAGDRHDKDEAAPAFEGLFFNYFSVGMDAEVAYGFHHLRDEKPWLARGRASNQMIYSTFGCTQGWFCTACSMAPRARGVSNILKLSVRKRGNASNDWVDVHLPSNVRAVVICNLKSYAGGRNPWGKPSSSTRQKGGLEEQQPDDGLLEIMGLKDGWHSAFVLLDVSTAVRLCQAEAVRLELTGRARRKAYMQMDGEPWMQPMGAPDDEPTVVMIDKLSAPSLLLKR